MYSGRSAAARRLRRRVRPRRVSGSPAACRVDWTRPQSPSSSASNSSAARWRGGSGFGGRREAASWAGEKKGENEVMMYLSRERRIACRGQCERVRGGSGEGEGGESNRRTLVWAEGKAKGAELRRATVGGLGVRRGKGNDRAVRVRGPRLERERGNSSLGGVARSQTIPACIAPANRGCGLYRTASLRSFA
eukprot:scaffold11371_cov112-Isochrysis_galbana.AAC.8